ncbi:MAG: hypothetical protein KA444_02925 [Bacteroidia bacterium]|nr:hypothetical protein [Bacteroidia bacterium]
MKIKFTLFQIALAILLFQSTISKAQYTTGAGVRVGKFASGVNVKHFFDTNGNTGVEIMAGITREAKGGYIVKGYFVRQLPIFNSMLQIPLDMVFGIGGHCSYYKYDYYSIKEGDPVYYKDQTIAAGMDAMFGLEYDTRKIPFTVGIDVNPFYSLLNPGPEWIDFGINARLKF